MHFFKKVFKKHTFFVKDIYYIDMVAKLLTTSIFGYKALPVQVQVDILPGNPRIQIVGLGDSSVKETKDRVRSAIYNSGFLFPVKEIIVNLAPNDIPKKGSICELAIAIGVLIASEQVEDSNFFKNAVVLGSLSLDGSIQNPQGIMTSVISSMQFSNFPYIIVPQESIYEISSIPYNNILFIKHLKDLKNFKKYSSNSHHKKFVPKSATVEIDMKDVIGMEKAKKALCISAAGRHHCFFIGTPGSGKTMLARAFQSILAPLTLQESLEVTQLYSACNLHNGSLIKKIPFRSPHHTISDIALVGGGSDPKPGEISLAHKGILFLDELLEFKNNVIQTLREPLEEKKISISRARGNFIFPANFILLAATNPCRCGYFLSTIKSCSCKGGQILTNFSKIIGPFIDRIGLEVEFFNQEKLYYEDTANNKSSSWWRSKVVEAKARMLFRNKGKYNSELKFFEIEKIVSINSNYKKILKKYRNLYKLSYRSQLISLSVAITLMDIRECSKLTDEIIEEAFQYRVLFKYQNAISDLMSI